jgi:hypothetical protein
MFLNKVKLSVKLLSVFMFAFSVNVNAMPELSLINRFVVAVSANNGGSERPVLRYAESDAKAFTKVLKEMGGVLAENVIVVSEPSVEKLQKEFSNLDQKILQNKNTNGRNEVLVYYSGHANEKGLQLGNEIYTWKELRHRIDSLHADVKIAVIDACGSGAITRVKGGRAIPAFIVDKSSDMKGYAFITSSTQDESSQESDKIKGSFFTHSLVSGLRGAGDLSNDGRVTLSEAYQFAFNETLQKTESTIGGAQHPSRDMNLVGTGDVVMTDLRTTSARLDLAENISGRLYIRDTNAELVAELHKKQGQLISLGLPSGHYTVSVQQNSVYKSTSVLLENGKHKKIVAENFKDVSSEQATFRGNLNSSRNSVLSSIDSLEENGKFQFTFNFLDFEENPRKGFQFGFFVANASDYMIGTQLSIFANIAHKEMHGLQLSSVVNFGLNHFEGAQLAPVVNYAKNFDGLQLSSVANIAKDKSSGTQISAAMNVIDDTLSGAQIAAGLNIAHTTNVQIVAGMNIAKKSNVQASGGINISGENSALQLAPLNIGAKENGAQVGVLNIAGKEKSFQVGVMNVAGKTQGRQWGVLNICGTCEKTPIGLINIVGNGVWNINPYVNEMGALGASLHLGTAYLYTNIEYAGFFEKGSGFKDFEKHNEDGIGLGTQFGKYGSHFELEYTFLQVNRKYSEHNTSEAGFHHRGRLGYVYQLCKGIGLSVGATLNFTSLGYLDNLLLKPFGDYHDDFGNAKHKVRWWPGFYAGFSLGKF